MKNILNYQTEQEFIENETVTSGKCIVRMRYNNEYDTEIGNVFVGDGWYRHDNGVYTGPYTFAATPVPGKFSWTGIINAWRITANGVEEELYALKTDDESPYYRVFVPDGEEGGVLIFRDEDRGYLYKFFECEQVGGVSSVEPGVAYCQENTKVYYQLPEKVTFEPGQFPNQGETFIPWRDAGIGMNNFLKYKALARNPKTHVDEWNVFVNLGGGESGKVVNFGYDSEHNVVFLTLVSCRYSLTINENGFRAGSGCIG